MIHDPFPWPANRDRPPIDLHQVECRCDVCVPYLTAPDVAEDISFAAGLALLGLIVGFLLTALFDFVTGGPGLGVMFGL